MNENQKKMVVIDMSKKYYRDGSHGWQHVLDVLSRAVKILRRELTVVETAAIVFHDAGVAVDRVHHHDIGAEIAFKELICFFTDDVLLDICNAIRHHRASYDGVRETDLENIVAAADREPPTDVERMYRRSYAYSLEHGLKGDDAIQATLNHIREKYGKDGYSFKRAPKLYLDFYKEDLENLWKQVSEMTKERLITIVG